MSKTDDLRDEADQISKLVLGCDRIQAWQRVKAGEMAKSDFAKRLVELMFLIAEDE
jgi:hypothetical protein